MLSQSDCRLGINRGLPHGIKLQSTSLFLPKSRVSKHFRYRSDSGAHTCILPSSDFRFYGHDIHMTVDNDLVFQFAYR